MSFEVRVVQIHLTVYHPDSLYISILVMYSIGTKFVFFSCGSIIGSRCPQYFRNDMIHVSVFASQRQIATTLTDIMQVSFPI